MPVAQLQNQNIGLPASPIAQQILIPSADKIEQGYDSDGFCGPSFEAVDNEVSLVWNEDEIIPTAIDPIQNQELEQSLTEDECRKMKVSELKEQLVLRNLSRNGRKADLLERLISAISNNMPLINNATPEQLANMAGDGFATTAHWELLDPGNYEVNDSLIDTDGHQFYPPVAGRLRNESINMGPPKKNYNETFDREPFIQSVILPLRNTRGKIRRDTDGNILYHNSNSDQTVPNIDYLHSHNISTDSNPVDWFELFMPLHRRRQENPNVITLDDLTSWSNKKAYLANAGSGGSNYTHWKPFSVT